MGHKRNKNRIGRSAIVLLSCLLTLNMFAPAFVMAEETGSEADSLYYVHHHFIVPQYMQARTGATETPELPNFTITGAPSVDTLAGSSFDEARSLAIMGQAFGKSSIALGGASVASGDYSIALGAGNTAAGMHDIAIGYPSSVGGGSLTFGHNTIAYGQDAIVGGAESRATVDGAIAIGSQITSTARGSYSFLATETDYDLPDYPPSGISLGVDSKATGGTAPTAFGNYSEASGKTSVAIGTETAAPGNCAIAIGTQATASGYCSVAIGYQSASSGDRSFALGNFAAAAQEYELTYGGTGNLAVNAVSGESEQVGGKYVISFEEFRQEALANGIPLRDILGLYEFEDMKFMVKAVYSDNPDFTWDKDRDSNKITANFKVADASETSISIKDGSLVSGTNMIEIYYAPCIEIPVKKEWKSEADTESRPESVTANLMAGNEVIDTLTLSDSNDWSSKFIVETEVVEGKTLSVEELEVDDYQTEISGDKEAGYTITNTFIKPEPKPEPGPEPEPNVNPGRDADSEPGAEQGTPAATGDERLLYVWLPVLAIGSVSLAGYIAALKLNGRNRNN